MFKLFSFGNQLLGGVDVVVGVLKFRSEGGWFKVQSPPNIYHFVEFQADTRGLTKTSILLEVHHYFLECHHQRKLEYFAYIWTISGDGDRKSVV